MENLTILKLNTFDQYFWSAKLGFDKTFTLLDYSEENLNQTAAVAQSIIVDFYFSQTSLDEEQEITLSILNALRNSGRKTTLFLLSPSYAGETIRKFTVDRTEIIKHNFSMQMIEEIAQNLNNTNKAS